MTAKHLTRNSMLHVLQYVNGVHNLSSLMDEYRSSNFACEIESEVESVAHIFKLNECGVSAKPTL